MPPLLVRIIRYGMIGVGASSVVTSVVNIVAAVQLLDPLAEESLGVTRKEVIGWYIIPGLFGLGMMIFGFCWRRKRDDG